MRRAGCRPRASSGVLAALSNLRELPAELRGLPASALLVWLEGLENRLGPLAKQVATTMVVLNESRGAQASGLAAKAAAVKWQGDACVNTFILESRCQTNVLARALSQRLESKQAGISRRSGPVDDSDDDDDMDDLIAKF